MIYFVQQGPGGPIKIGFTSKPIAKRLADIQVHSPHPVTLLALIDGDKSIEALWHERFAARRMKGEWFMYTPEFEVFCRSLGTVSQEIPTNTLLQLDLPKGAYDRLVALKAKTEAASYAEVVKNALKVYAEQMGVS